MLLAGNWYGALHPVTARKNYAYDTEAASNQFSCLESIFESNSCQGGQILPRKLKGLINWKLFISTLGLIFLSEMGDKTQITTLLLAGAKPWYVFWIALGSASALICTSFLEVIIGSEVIARFLKPRTIQLLSGFVFMLLGTLLITGMIGNVQIK